MTQNKEMHVEYLWFSWTHRAFKPFTLMMLTYTQMVFRRMTVPIHGIAFIMNLRMYPLITPTLSDIGPAIRKLVL